MKANRFDVNSLFDVVSNRLSVFFASHANSVPANVYDTVVQQIEKALLIETLRYTKGNQLLASKVLGINRNTLRKKIALLGITEVDFVKAESQ